MILLQATKTRIEALRFSPDGRYLVAVDDYNDPHVWDDPVHDRSASRAKKCASAEFLPSGGKLLLVTTWDHDAHCRHYLLHDLAGGPEVELFSDGAAGYLWCGPTPDGRHFLRVYHSRGAGRPADITLHRLDAPADPLWRVQSTAPVDSPPAFLAGGTRFALFHWSALVVREQAEGATAAEVDLPGGWHHAVTARDGPLIAGRRTNRAAVFRADDLNAAPVILKNDGRKEITGLAFHPSGRYLAATSNDATVKVYDTETWRLVHIFTWQVGRMRSVAFSPDGMLAAAGSDTGQVVLWDWDL